MSVQHIAFTADWEQAQRTGAYDRSTRGASIDEVGFLHASDGPEQVRTVLGRFYADVTEPLVLLTLDEPALAAAGLRVVREPGDPSDPDSERFPHVYGGPLPVAAVSRVEPLVRPENDLGRPSGAAPVMPGPQQATPEATAPFDAWRANADRTEY